MKDSKSPLKVIIKRNLKSKYFISSQNIISKSSIFDMEEFIINKFLKLRLEDNKTIIYVNNERFNQCKFLLLDFPVDKITSLEDIESIDDVAQRLDPSLENENKNEKEFGLLPEVEFWGHCSNLQVWYENKYNTKLIHRSLAFPLLRKLMEVGDMLAKRVIREEIAVRFSEGNETVREYLRIEGYLGYLDSEQFCSLLYSIKFNSFNELLKIISTYFIINRKSITEFLEFIESLDNKDLREFFIDPKETNQFNFYQAIVKCLEENKEVLSEFWRNKDNFKKVSVNLFDFLKKLIIDKDGYINLPVLEALIYIDNERIKNYLMNTDHKFKFRSILELWDFQYILNVLLRCFDPEELLTYLEENHKEDIIKIVLPKVLGFKFLKMSDQDELDMRQFLTAYLLEEAGTDDYRENIKKLGNFLAETFLSELIDRYNEVNEQIIKTLAWIGGDARMKLIDKLYYLFGDHQVKYYKNKFREYFKGK